MKQFLLSRYQNTDKAALYTYEVDVCFMAALAAKLSFPWIYEYFTGNNCELDSIFWQFGGKFEGEFPAEFFKE